MVLGVESIDEARSAFERILSAVRAHAPQAHVDGVQIQRMMPPGREMVVGTVRDADFGPMVMLGFGGIYVEVLRDVVFDLAPVTLEQAHAMIGRLHGRALLEGVRGEPPADRQALAEILVAASAMAAEPFGGIREVDLNPVVVYAEGQGACALDALIVHDEN